MYAPSPPPQDIALQDGILDGDLFGTDILPVALSVFNGQTYFEALEYADGLLAQANPCPRCVLAPGLCVQGLFYAGWGPLPRGVQPAKASSTQQLEARL